jgi:ATP/maltotriose-dependent transcriptional regulator MalT
MSKKLWLLPLAAGMLAMSPLVVGQDQVKQQDQTRQQDRVRTQDQEQVYGSQLMTQQERTAYRAKMRAAKTQEERERVRAEHHEQMKVRAKERGVTLPDEPPARGGGMSPGGGMGPGGGGMGPGGGMGGGSKGRY